MRRTIRQFRMIHRPSSELRKSENIVGINKATTHMHTNARALSSILAALANLSLIDGSSETGKCGV